MPEPWPYLSNDLPGPRAPDTCQKCGRHWDALKGENLNLVLWEECDDQDRPRGVHLFLCSECNGNGLTPKGNPRRTLVEKHPRLYKHVSRWTPLPGLVPLCTGCVHRVGLSCTSPRRKANGGAGIKMQYPPPAHVSCRPRSLSHYVYPGPPISCEGREEGTAAEPWPVPGHVARCPECDARLVVEVDEWEEPEPGAASGHGSAVTWWHPTEGGCRVWCVNEWEEYCNPDGSTGVLDSHRNRQSVWYAVDARVLVWARREIRRTRDAA